MHPTNTGPEYIDEDGYHAKLIQCPDCGQLEWWTNEECWEHGHCRATTSPCVICASPRAR
jgi:hypothetical protein